MKRTMAIVFFALANLVTTGSALAQHRGFQANIPFDFTVGGKVLPAGVYAATTPLAGVMVIRSLDERISVITTFTPDVKDKGPDGKWVFQRYGEQYFLLSVLIPAAGIHASVPTSSLEKSVHRQQAYPRGGAPVLVAANERGGQ